VADPAVLERSPKVIVPIPFTGLRCLPEPWLGHLFIEASAMWA